MIEERKHLLDLALPSPGISLLCAENPCRDVRLYRSREFRLSVPFYTEEL